MLNIYYAEWQYAERLVTLPNTLAYYTKQLITSKKFYTKISTEIVD
jgi:hypothetical protein